jgi:hypothetical protein
MWLNMFRVFPRPSSGAYNCISNLWFYRWCLVVAAPFFAAGEPMRCLLVKNHNTRMVEKYVAEEMEELGIYTEEVVEFSSRFRDQDTECIVTRHCT